MLDGRVKTLHPKVHGGILHIRANAEHVAAINEHAIEPIDMVVVNLYAFEKTAEKPGAHLAEIIENIDIGGPSMVRSAAKNFADVAIVTNAADYDSLAAELEASGGSLALATRWRLAKAAFAPPPHTTQPLRTLWSAWRNRTAAKPRPPCLATPKCQSRCD